MAIEIKTSQPSSMILVSFLSEDNVLSDEIKNNAIFSNIKVTKIERSALFFGHPVYARTHDEVVSNIFAAIHIFC